MKRATLKLLNVDLDVESGADLHPLEEALAPYAYSLERPPGLASFELNAAVSPTDPEPLILELMELIRALSPAPRAVWDGASRRVFDIGIQSGHHPFRVTYFLTSETLRQAAELGADVAITVYAPDPNDSEGL